MAIKKHKLLTRVGNGMFMMIDSCYKAVLLLRERKGIEGKYSKNDFINEALWGYMEGIEGKMLLGVYESDIAPVELEERLRRGREESAVIASMEDDDGW